MIYQIFDNSQEDKFKQALATTYLPVTRPDIRDKTWDLAWEHGHSSGFSEVEAFYMDLADIVRFVEKS